MAGDLGYDICDESEQTGFGQESVPLQFRAWRALLLSLPWLTTCRVSDPSSERQGLQREIYRVTRERSSNAPSAIPLPHAPRVEVRTACTPLGRAGSLSTINMLR